MGSSDSIIDNIYVVYLGYALSFTFLPGALLAFSWWLPCQLCPPLAGLLEISIHGLQEVMVLGFGAYALYLLGLIMAGASYGDIVFILLEGSPWCFLLEIMLLTPLTVYAWWLSVLVLMVSIIWPLLFSSAFHIWLVLSMQTVIMALWCRLFEIPFSLTPSFWEVLHRLR